jgi:hypothetical protein
MHAMDTVVCLGLCVCGAGGVEVGCGKSRKHGAVMYSILRSCLVPSMRQLLQRAVHQQPACEFGVREGGGFPCKGRGWVLVCCGGHKAGGCRSLHPARTCLV